MGAISERSRILDVGCGWGATALHLREKGHGCHYTGLTPSRVQIEFIRALKLQDCNVIEGFFEGFAQNISAHKFDLILFTGSICHMQNKQDALSLAKELLTDDGAILVEDTFFVSESAFRQHKDHPATKFVQNDIFGFAEITSLSRFAEEVAAAGLKITHSIEHSTSYKKTIECWISRLQELPETQFPEAPRFVKYMNIANKGWNRTTMNYLHKIEKLARK